MATSISVIGGTVANLPVRGVFAIAGDASARVFWNDTATPGVSRTVTASTGQTATGTTSPITVSGLTNGTAVTFTVKATGGLVSWASDAVTPTSGDPGVIYYVDSVAGSNANNGTSTATPLQSIATAMGKTLTPGDAVLLKRGSRWNNEAFGTIAVSGSSNRPITIGAYGQGPAPYLYGGTRLTGWAVSSGTTYSVALSRASGSYPGMLWVNRQYRARGASSTTLNNNEWFYNGTTMFYRNDAGNPDLDGAAYEVGTTRDCVTVGTTRTDWIIRDLQIHLYNRSAANTAGSSNTRIVYAENQARQVGCQSNYTGVPGGNNGVFALFGASFCIVRGNDCRGCNTDNYYGLGIQDCEFIDNVGILAVGFAADLLQIDQNGGVDPGGTQGAVDTFRNNIRRNYFDQRGTPSPKGCIISFSIDDVVENNVCYGGNFGISPAWNQIVRYNKVYEVGVETHLDWPGGIYSENNSLDIQDTLVHHNLVVGCETGIILWDGQRRNFRVFNNTVTGSVRQGTQFNNTWSSTSPSQWRNDIYYNPKAGSEGIPSGTGLQTSTNLSGTNPQFIDKVDYVPGSGSPARNAGTVIAGITDGYLGSAPDIGYIEAG
jgi:hypothetical protein